MGHRPLARTTVTPFDRAALLTAIPAAFLTLFFGLGLTGLAQRQGRMDRTSWPAPVLALLSVAADVYWSARP
jgi:hypothetical protein